MSILFKVLRCHCRLSSAHRQRGPPRVAGSFGPPRPALQAVTPKGWGRLGLCFPRVLPLGPSSEAHCSQHPFDSQVKRGTQPGVSSAVGLGHSYARSGPVQSSSVTQSCPSLCDPMDRSTPGLPVHHQLPEFTQIQYPLSL